MEMFGRSAKCRLPIAQKSQELQEIGKAQSSECLGLSAQEIKEPSLSLPLQPHGITDFTKPTNPPDDEGTDAAGCAVSDTNSPCLLLL